MFIYKYIYLASGILCPYIVTTDKFDVGESRKNSGKGSIKSIWKKKQLLCGRGIQTLVVVWGTLLSKRREHTWICAWDSVTYFSWDYNLRNIKWISQSLLNYYPLKVFLHFKVQDSICTRVLVLLYSEIGWKMMTE